VISWVAGIAVAVAAVAVAVAGVAATQGTRTRSPTITIDGARDGPVFWGIGAISGGGGNSRLLIDYPQPERGQILDYLFKPGYGASLQILKLEIGGDGNSTDGSEPSVEHVRGQVNCSAGYEFWLARQALARNPAIKIYGLQWAAPSWVKDSHGRLWSRADVTYVTDWMTCARRQGIDVSYLGGWNERYRAGAAYERRWYENLRAALDATGFARTRIVAADYAPSGTTVHGQPATSPQPDYRAGPAWNVARDLAASPAFNRAVSVIGAHDTCQYPTTGRVCESTATARSLGKPLWESELGALPAHGTGPAALAQAINNAYIQARITGIILWPAIDSMPPALPREDRGLVWADHPWDGSYTVNPLAWVTAQTTQFARPGWRYVGGASGSLPGPDGGSYVTYQAPDHSAWSLVAQTAFATGPQAVTMHITGGLPGTRVRVWRTSLRGGTQFAHLPDLIPHSGVFTATLGPGYVYSFTTTTGQSAAGGAAPRMPAALPMPLPYTARPDASGQASMLAPMEGSFEYVHGVLTQTAAGQPVKWRSAGPLPAPYAIAGWSTWRDYTVSADVSLPPVPGGRPAGAMLIARFGGYTTATGTCQFLGYTFRIDSTGVWKLAANGPTPVTLASGRVRAAGGYRISLAVHGSTITAAVDGTHVVSVSDSRFREGPAGLGALGYYPVQYRSFTVR
jgi:hypothetical protein